MVNTFPVPPVTIRFPTTSTLPLLVKPVTLLIVALNVPPSLSVIVNVLALSYVNPVTKVFVFGVIPLTGRYSTSPVTLFLINISSAFRYFSIDFYIGFRSFMSGLLLKNYLFIS